MRKLFLLISVLTLSIAVNATTINITPTSPYGENDNLRKAVYYATAGDEIVLADGTYFEPSSGGYLALNKNLTIKAAEGAHPVVQMEAYAQLTASAKVKFQGIKFDGSVQGSYDYYFRAYDVSASSLIFEDCEFYDIKNEVFRAKSDVHMDSLIVNNCYFHNNKKNIVYFEASGTEGRQTCNKLVFMNSTIAKSDSLKNHTSTIDIKPYATGGSNTDAIKVIIDHCTFYDNPTINTDHSAIRPYYLSDVTISNCIFVKGPNQKEKRNATSCYGGTISNCLVCGLDYSSSGHRSGPTVTGNIVADPLFNDLANNRYTYDGNWSTGSISPARGAATDGSDLGDPRWYTDETIPSTSFASAYDLLGTKAQLKGNIRLNASNHIEYYNNSENGTAKWKLHIGRTCRISAVADREAESTSGCTLTLTVYNADGDEVSAISAARSDNDNDIIFPGTLNIPEEGDYTIVLTNAVSWSSAILEKITLTYEGGAVKDISTSTNTTLNVADAWSSGCTRDNDKTYIQYPSSGTSDAWIKWNIATSETKYYDLTVNVNTEYNHGFTAAIYEDEDADPVASVTEGSFVETKGVLALELGRVNLVGGKNYIVKVTNAPSGSQAKVTSVVFAPVVATATELPGTLAFSNAVLSEKANITDGMLYFNEPGADKDPRGEWAQWEVTTNHNGLFLFTMGVTSSNGQNYKITIKDDGDNELDYYETSLDSGDKTVTHYFALSAGNYFVKVENTRSYSKGHLTSLVVTEPAGVVTLDEATDNNTSWASLVGNDNTYDVQIKRTIKADMYNTFCLPFEVTSSQCKDIFGSDVQIRTLDSATVDEDFVLTLDFKKSSDIYPGTPVLIQTSRDIVNPVFTGVKFTRETPSATTKTNANFTGTFVKTALDPDENTLFLGANNKLYFPTASVDMYGMRGWFVIHGVSASAIKRARIVENHNTATDIEIVGSQKKVESQKLIENGQLIIIRDGIRYNVMGARVK